MIKIKDLYLKNYCGYRDTHFSFKKNDKINNMSVFFGPNGTGKTNVLQAINLLCNAKRYQEMNTQLSFRKLTYHPDYDPTYQLFQNEHIMEISGIFETDDGDKEVVMSSKEEKGVLKNELPYSSYGHCYYIDADNPMNMSKFQLHDEMETTFLDLAKNIYNFDCELGDKYNALNEKAEYGPDGRLIKSGEYFFTDFIINKYHNTVKVHFKRMSAGEKKIAVLLKDLCNPEYIQNMDIVLIDNAELHIYFKRHPVLVDKLIKTFPDKQFIATTHSETIIKHIGEKYKPDWLYDLEWYKEEEYKKLILGMPQQ